MDRNTRLALALLWLTAGGGAFAMEGKWTPDQILALDPAWLRHEGLELPPAQLWSAAGGGLLEATVRITGCTAGLISGAGLLITNHHCALSTLQQHSSPERDLIARGYLAATREAELPGRGVRATVPHRTVDVTAEVEASVPAGADDLARYQAIERKRKELVAACEQAPGRRCEVAAYDGGLRYLLIESLEFPDVRLVYAPPSAVGDYGGEEDNWSWPRHAGDFALLRVYAGPEGQPAPAGPANRPYAPRHFFTVSARGARPGDFVMVSGYPGLTFRSLTAAEMAELAELWFPARAALYRVWIDLMEAAAAGSDQARIALADRVKALANREKNARGQLAGLGRGRVLERKREAEAGVLAWARQQPAQAAAVEAQRELAALVERRRATWQRSFLLEQMRQGPKPLELALTLVRWAEERAKPDLEREPAYMERNRERALEALRNDQKRLHPPAEAALLADLLRRFAALPEGSRVREGAAVRARAEDLLRRTRVCDLEERVRMFGETGGELRARHDPLLDFAFAVLPELLAQEQEDHRFQGAVSRLRPRWQRAVIAHAGRPVAPDANGTLRVTLGHVAGYSPRDAVWMKPQTTVAGMAAKSTGVPPFAAPARLLAAAPRAPESPYADRELHDVPVCFLADADTTGGNSGSPVVNGRGELVGVNFDRVWENVANDFGYVPEVARNISTDVRYLLWVLTTLEGGAAHSLLREMAVEPER